MAYLVTGGTGKAAKPLVGLLQEAKVPFILTSRRGQEGAPPGTKAIRFDWNDQTTWAAAFSEGPIKGVYLVAPLDPNPAQQMNPFIDLAIKNGVGRFVMVAGSSIQKGGYWLGQVWQHLDEKGVEYSVLRPSWFLENLLQSYHVKAIKDEGKIYSGTGDGKAGFVAAKDIANVCFRALTSENPVGQDLLVLGPELVNYDEIAATMSQVLGRKIDHVNLKDEENADRLMKSGEPEFLARFFVSLEQRTKAKEFEAHDPKERNDSPAVLGRPATSVAEWAEENKSAWL